MRNKDCGREARRETESETELDPEQGARGRAENILRRERERENTKLNYINQTE